MSHRALSESAVGALRTFAYFTAGGTIGSPDMQEVDYWQTMHDEPSLMEAAFAIFGNVLRVDDDGRVLNGAEAGRRASQWVRQYMTGVPADPPWEDWEVELHDPA